MVEFRKAAEKDLQSLIELNVRLKRLNEEFDPLLRVRADLAEKSREYFSAALRSPNALVVVAEDNGKVVGFIKADVRERAFYEPRMEGNIVEFYLLPEYRRRGVGAKLLDYTIKLLKEKAEIITAEFPTLNEIAVEFYTKLGFRGVVSVYARESP